MSDRVRSLTASGAFRDALQAAKSHQRSILANGEDEITLGELLERTGQPVEAARLARRVLGKATATPAVRARALTLLGTVHLDSGETDEAISVLSQAVSAATASGARYEACWAKLRLFVALSYVSAPESMAGPLSDLRRHVNRVGNVATTTALHIFVAQIETQRGVVETAARHARVATTLLSQQNNLWLSGLAAIDDLCLAFYASDHPAARESAGRALGLAARSGHVRTELAAITNLAHIDLAEDRLSQSDLNFRRALAMCRTNVRSRCSVLDGLAQLKMTTLDFDDALRHLQATEGLGLGEASYERISTWVTRCRLLLKMGDYAGVVQLSTQTAEVAQRYGFRRVLPLVLLARAEANALLGKHALWPSDIYAALASGTQPSLELLADVHRAMGRALSTLGDVDGVGEAYHRSTRVLSALGRKRDLRETLAEARACGWALPDLLTPVQAAAPRTRPEFNIQRAATLLQVASRPDLLGSEALGLLDSAGAITAGAILAIDDAGRARAESMVRCGPAEAIGLPANGDCYTLSLGTWRGCQWTLAAKASDQLSSLFTWASIRALVSSGLELARARQDARERQALWPIDNPDTQSPGVFNGEQALELLRVARRVAASDSLILLTGETGVGKDVLARIIHDASSRAGRPFVPFNCSAVPRDMVESQLFGHRRGAFTGADHASPGVIRAAEGGTLFLDEIGEVPLDLQPKLLRFLDQREVHPLGDPQPSKVDVRVVAATNRHLDDLVREGRFREDLYYRLLVIQLAIPPLRERREEIPGLAEHFLGRFARENQKGHLRIADETMEYLVLYAWPGNVRQLMNELRRMATLAETDAVLMPEHLHQDIVSTRRTRPASERDLASTEVVVRLDQPLAAATEHLERAIIQYAMGQCDGRLEQVSQLLGVSRKGLYLKRQRLGLEDDAG